MGLRNLERVVFGVACFFVILAAMVGQAIAEIPHTKESALATASVKPATLSVAAVGPATTHHIALEMLKRAAGVDFSLAATASKRPVSPAN